MPPDPIAELPPSRRYPVTGVFATGPSEGEDFPAATLPDQRGVPVQLEWGEDGRRALVVFHRSARWCAFCRTQLRHLQEHLPAFEAAGVGLFAVSYDPPGALAEFAAENGITYPLLSDEGSHFIRRLGILNDLVRPEEEIYGIPFPGAFAVSRDGRIIRKYFYRHYRERPAPLGVLREAFDADVDLSGCLGSDTTVQGRHVSVRLADKALVPYQHTPLFVRVTPPVDYEVAIQAAGLEVDAPTRTADLGSTEFAATLVLRSLDIESLKVTVTVTPPGGPPLGLELNVPVPALNRAQPH